MPNDHTPATENDYTPTRFRKRPVEVEAMLYEPHHHHDWTQAQAVTEWCGGKFYPGAPSMYGPGEGYPYIAIETLEGVMKASPGDYIIRGVQGEFYPCKPDIFLATYEPSANPTPPEEQAHP